MDQVQEVVRVGGEEPGAAMAEARGARQHKRVITTAGEHDISCRNHNKNIPCGLLVRDKTQSRGVVWCFSDLHPTATARDDQICVWLAERRRAQRPGRGDRASATSPFVFGPSDSESRAVTRKAEPRDPPNAECTGINWTCIGGYNHLTFTGNMRAVVFVFVDLS